MSIDIIQKRMPSAFFVECLLTNPSLISIRGIRWTNPSHTTPSRCRIIPFLLEYHQSHDVKYSVTLFRPKQPTTYTHTLSSQNIDIVSFIPNRFESIDPTTPPPTTTTTIRSTTIASSVDGRNDVSDHPLPSTNIYRTTLARLFLSIPPFFSLWLI